MKTVDIVIVNYNSTQELLGCIQSIYRCGRTTPFRIDVQDNSPRNDNLKHVLRDFSNVIVTENAENLGFAKAANRALRQGRGPYVYILNPDTIIQPGLFETTIRYMEDHPEVGVLGPRILDSDGTVQGSARKFPSLLTALFGRKSILTKIFPNNPVTRGNILTVQSDGESPMPVDWVSGACMLVRRAAIDTVGPLDEAFFMYWEDADWCRRMWQGGWRVAYFPGGEVTHHVGVSSETNVFRSVLEFHRSIYRLFDKHATGAYAFLKPAVFWSIVFRFFFVLASQWFRKVVKRPRKRIFKQIATVPVPASEKIRILRFIARLNIGGPSIHVHLLTTGLDKNTFDSTLVTGKISPQEGDMGYLFDFSEEKPIIVASLQREISTLMDLKAFFEILKLLTQKSPHIVHTHTAKAGTTVRLAAMLYNGLRQDRIHSVHTFHGHVFSGYFSPAKSMMFIWIERFLAKFTHTIIAISKSQKEDLVYGFQIAPSQKIRVIPLGFNLDHFLKSDLKKGRFRKRLGLSQNTALVGIVGRLVPIKNHLLFLNMAKIFLDKNPGMGVQFLLIGDGELRAGLENFVEINGLAGHVHFCGWLQDLTAVYADLDVLALTSQNEGTPVSIIEAMAAATPVITTDAGGVRDLLGSSINESVRQGFTVCERGILCPRNDAERFASGLLYLISLDNDQKKNMIESARSFVLKSFSGRRLLSDMEKLYLEMVYNKASVPITRNPEKISE